MGMSGQAVPSIAAAADLACSSSRRRNSASHFTSPLSSSSPACRHEPGAYTRPLFSSTSAISDTKYTRHTP